MTAQPKVTLTRERVVAEAVALADESGLGSLSMRALATRLGVEAMSLYHHVRNKDELLDAMIDVVFGEMHPPRPRARWRPELRRRSVSGREALRRHRWAVGLMDARRTPGPASIAHHDAVLGCLFAGGFSLVAAGTAFALLDAHLYGFLVQENALPFETEAELADIGAAIIGPEVRAAFPHFTRYAEERAMQPGYRFADEFERTLDLTLDAVASLR
ncbi:AcrR family transcriptional regulator [Knoellia sinensis KCTC 19936]|uniref:AcrR family transcriptional regulator n=1 Tax=Knoellia sinensis KCTC 19936 TaxID=1385520 RepID=A0A0A0J2W6_9MICO|nr:TetR/AcrR family transcriptional regulator C-terminal domain-containing protein [Knoellia sinensis]KGN31483.1 AcrR family transcriptional regulator [Knoellia sinensis KCTC 19936]